LRPGTLAACVRGDHRAWESIVRCDAGLVYKTIRSCGFKGDDAADLFQDVWLTVWQEGLERVYNEAALPGWLVTIAARRALREGQLHGRSRPTERLSAAAYEEPDLDPEPEEIAIGQERSSALRAALAKLPERERQVIGYFFYEPTGPTYAEIAARLGVLPGTIGPLRRRCLRLLLTALEDAPELADDAP